MDDHAGRKNLHEGGKWEKMNFLGVALAAQFVSYSKVSVLPIGFFFQ